MGSGTRFWLLTGLMVVMLVAPVAVWAQWGAIQRGIEATRPQPVQGLKPEEQNAPHNVADESVAGPGLASPMTFQNAQRPFSYTIPAGWRQESGNPTGDRVVFMKPGTTASFNFHFTQMVPSFPRKAAVDAGYKQAKEEMTIGKYMSVKRRNQGNVIGWETIETAEKGSGGFQRIQWQCYDGQNYYYSFMTACDPRQFPQHRAAMQQIIDSVRFSR
ncbi:MAG: hypothetical protein ACOC6K_01780 [Thermodesulfobacteriota bacterium]